MSRKSTPKTSRKSAPLKVEPSDLKAFVTPPSSPLNARDTTAPLEDIYLPEATRERSLTPEEAKIALRELFNGDTDNSSTSAHDSEAFVRGFREGFTLMPHQVLSRAWMREREDFTKKKAGGILADEMGMGKTIQVITRILDRPPTQTERGDGWAKATLIVCPLAVMDQWTKEINKFTAGLKVIQYHGSKRGKFAADLADANVVLTTYGTVCSDHSSINPEDRTVGSVLFTIKWWRIGLDEAHTIKNRKTKTAAACFDLQARFRWCLTATPMQNEVDEFFPLLKFLRIKPLNDWERFNQLIAKPISKGISANLALKRLQMEVVLTHVMFRRTKTEVASVLKLPKRTVVTISCKFDSSEEQFYVALKTNVQTLLERIQAQNGKSTYMYVLVLLLRLRQACDHPCLVLHDYGDDMDGINAESKLNLFGNADEDDDNDGKPKCQMCLTRLTHRNIADRTWPNHCINCAALKVQAQNLHSSKRASAKIRTILRLLQRIARDSDGQEKTVIFSQFTAMLDIIETFLMACGIDFVRYDGKMSVKERTAALAEIEQNPRKTVILVSLKAGGVGLNLTACNHVILVDMWWNPAVEEQAFDRTHRVGQTRDVHIYRLKINDTVEDRILELQEKKRQLTKMALSGDQIKNKGLNMDELLRLFK
ncbi:DNA repair protein RAD5 [Mycena sanguinolenta]|uniref:DNA repair protein RAD5 n=1 Tax=Mycena sanguinolenta TaxID=230812 RepID=A0A8H6XCV2_9AGAR|nr:DNA repair protein RAD5 [Mycena sanguinolenta]